MLPPGLPVSWELAVVQVSRLPPHVTLLAVVETDVDVGQLLLAGGAMSLYPLATFVAFPLALGRSRDSCTGLRRGLFKGSHGRNGLAAAALGIPHMPTGVSVLGQLTCIQPLYILGDLLSEILW